MKALYDKCMERFLSSVVFLVIVGFAISSTSAFAQATYLYTGQPFEPPFTSLVQGVTFTTADHISATLRLDQWIPANSQCLDTTKLPGFRLVLYDGLTPRLDSADSTTSFNSIAARISTDAAGQITDWGIQMTTNAGAAPNSSISNLATGSGACTAKTIDSAALIEEPSGNPSSGSNGNSPGVWTLSKPHVLARMLINQFQLGILPADEKIVHQLYDVVEDLSRKRNDVCRDLAEINREVISSSPAPIYPAFTPNEMTFINITLTNIGSSSDFPTLSAP